MPSRRLLAGVVAALLGLAACQVSKPPPILPGAATPSQLLRVAVAALPASTDPALTPPYDSGVARTAFEALLKPRAGLTDVQPAGAASYEVSSDGLTYTFHLQPHGAWSDGVPVRAQDFVLGWRRILDPRINSPVADLFAQRIKNAAAYAELDPKKDAARIPAFLDGLGLKAADDRTFVVQLDHAAPDFKWITSVPAGAPARADAPAGGARPGNGPFHLESAGKESIVLAANLHYWAGRPHLDKIVLNLRGDATADLTRFLTGGEEMTTVPQAMTWPVTRDPGLSRNLVKVPLLGQAWAQFNVHRPPFDNAGVRLAFAQAIDRDQLLSDVLLSTLADNPAVPSVGPVPQGLRDYRPALAAQRFDTTGSKATLAASGAGSASLTGIRLLVRSLPLDLAVATSIAAQVKQHLGVELTIDARPSPAVSAALQKGDFQVQAPGGWLADYPDEQNFLDLFRTEDFSQWSRYSSAGFDHLVGQADGEPDPARRLQLYAQAQQLLAQEAPVAFLYQPEAWNLKQPQVRGATYTAIDGWPGDLFAADLSIAPR
jgi:oligopeptide transport system substrate-binding protein